MESRLAAAAAQASGVHQLGKPVAAFPFDPIRKLVSRAWQVDGARWLAVAGAPEAVLARCSLDGSQRARSETQVDRYAHRGLRVIAFARRDLDTGSDHTGDTPADVERELGYVGLAASPTRCVRVSPRRWPT